MTIVPLLLNTGVNPTVAVATASCKILFTSFAASTSFYDIRLALVGLCPRVLLPRVWRQSFGTPHYEDGPESGQGQRPKV